MANLTSIVLDVLKPHKPDLIDLACQVADLGEDYLVEVLMEEIDDKTHSISLKVSGSFLDYKAIVGCIEAVGGSIHSLDEVCVKSHHAAEQG